jgi:adenosylmethionine-8-amino-7-oxononanoate aminotransferase
MCVGKAMTGGYLSMGATLCTEEVAATVSAAPPWALMHGPTFMGNPLAAAVSLASVDLLLSRPWAQEVGRVGTRLAAGLAAAYEVPGVVDVRVLGAMGVIELQSPVDMARVTPVLLDHGVWLRPFGRLVYAMPAYVMSDSDLDRVSAAMVALARAAAPA